jgi:hypothetical protein
MRNRPGRRERGMTFIGLVILIAFVGMFIYAGIRLLPVYVEYFNIVRSIEGLKSDAEVGVPAMKIALEKRFDIEDVKSISYKDVEFRKEGSGWAVHAEYDAPAPFIGNVSFLVHFDKTVILGAGGP